MSIDEIREKIAREMGMMSSGGERMWNIVNTLLKGSVDMHVHSSPDPVFNVEWRIDSLEAAAQAQEAGMRAIVLKSHTHCTAPITAIISKLFPNITLFGGFCIDYVNGGLSEEPVETAAKLGAKVLWMPTIDAIPSCEFYQHRKSGGISILDSEGTVLPIVTKILEIARHYNMVVCSGHLPFTESQLLFKEAKRLGLTKLIATHPQFGPAPPVWPPFSLDELRQLAAMGVYIELTFLDGAVKAIEPVHVLGAESCIMSSDCGMITMPPPVESMRLFITSMLVNGFSQDKIETMIKINPKKLLDLD